MLVPVDTYGRQHHLHLIVDATVEGNALMMNDANWRCLAFHATVPAALEVLDLRVMPVVEQLWVQ